MAQLAYESEVRREDAGTYAVVCACGFTSTGWARKRDAADRRDGHALEHDTGEPGAELLGFREERGLNGATLETVELED